MGGNKMIDIIRKQLTRQEFKESINIGGWLEIGDDEYSCPEEIGLSHVDEEECNGTPCSECWEKAIENVKFKGENNPTSMIQYTVNLDIVETIEIDRVGKINPIFVEDVDIFHNTEGSRIIMLYLIGDTVLRFNTDHWEIKIWNKDGLMIKL